MRSLIVLAACGLVAAADVANAADVPTGARAIVTLASDYDFRGITRTAQDPALQAQVDYNTDSGWFIGGIATNVDFGPAADVNYEVDLFTGIFKSFDNGWGYDVGLQYYAYPDEGDFNYIEAYGTVSYDVVLVGLWYSPDFGGDTTRGNTEAYYLQSWITIPLPSNFSLLGHAGYSAGDYWKAPPRSEYFDYYVGVGYKAGNFNLALKWVDGSDLEAADGTPGDVLSSEARVVFTIDTIFPWK